MKNIFLLGCLLCLSLSARAETFRLNEYVFDKVFRTLMYVDSIDSNYYYIRYLRGDETRYPRNAQDLVKLVDHYGRVSPRMEVTYLNANTRQWERDTVKYVFANGIVWFDGVLGKYGIYEKYLGVETQNANTSLRPGDIACPIERTTHHRAPKSRGVVTKLYDNGAALMKFKDFLVVNAWEVVPFSNLTQNCQK